MVIPTVDPWVGGGGLTDLGEILLCGGAVNAPFGVVYGCGEPPYGKYPGGVPPPGVETDRRETPPEIRLLVVGINHLWRM